MPSWLQPCSLAGLRLRVGAERIIVNGGGAVAAARIPPPGPTATWRPLAKQCRRVVVKPSSARRLIKPRGVPPPPPPVPVSVNQESAAARPVAAAGPQPPLAPSPDCWFAFRDPCWVIVAAAATVPRGHHDRRRCSRVADAAPPSDSIRRRAVRIRRTIDIIGPVASRLSGCAALAAGQLQIRRSHRQPKWCYQVGTRRATPACSIPPRPTAYLRIDRGSAETSQRLAARTEFRHHVESISNHKIGLMLSVVGGSQSPAGNGHNGALPPLTAKYTANE